MVSNTHQRVDELAAYLEKGWFYNSGNGRILRNEMSFFYYFMFGDQQ